MSKMWHGALAGVGLAALMGCGGGAKSHSAPADTPSATDAASVGAATDPEFPVPLDLLGWKRPVPFSPPRFEPSEVEGDGAKFPLQVSFVWNSTGKPVKGWLAGSWYPETTHPDTEWPGAGSRQLRDGSDAVVRYESFTPAVHTFVLAGRDDPRISINCGVWVQPPNGRLTFEFDDFDLEGTVLGADGEPFAAGWLKFYAKEFALPLEVAKHVRHTDYELSSWAGDDGKFKVSRMIAGTWVAEFVTNCGGADPRRQIRRVRQVCEIKPGQPLILTYEKAVK